jgi:outer membrane protein OmpA-like peptidoglycan-associated protein
MWQQNTAIRRVVFLSLLLVSISTALLAQEIRPQPKLWFGGAAGANFNWYNGTTQILNENLTSPNPFHRGSGVGTYLAFGLEYRPNPALGGMLYVGFDDRSGKWKDNVEPCGEAGHLATTLSYISIEPSLRISPFKSSFYFFLGPRIGMNTSKEFTFEVVDIVDSTAEFSEVHSTVVSGQIGVGNDFHLSKENDPTQVDLSPFLSFHPYFGQNPRSAENWAVTTVRAGVILKVGKGKVGKRNVAEAAPVILTDPIVTFSVRAPKVVPVKRRVRESFPLRNCVFFDDGSSNISKRYVVLTKDQARDFNEEQLQDFQPTSNIGRPARQIVVYYNILNILGDRMRRSSGSTITLSGASDKGAAHGKARAESIKKYLVDVYEIDGSRITTEGREKPLIPSEARGSTMDIVLLHAEDQRVDIETSSPELAIQVGGAPHYRLKPVQIVDVVEDPLEGHVIFTVTGAKEALDYWSLEITDEQGNIQKFGPFTSELETIPGNNILGGGPAGDYKVALVEKTKDGRTFRKESSVSLMRRDEPKVESLEFRIQFDFDKSETVAKYEKFLTDVVTPLISNNSIVVIHGYTDIVGMEEYNYNLSRERAQDTQKILEKALTKAGTKGVTFETLQFGEDTKKAQFANDSPEGRFYNRTVIIDIVPEE